MLSVTKKPFMLSVIMMNVGMLNVRAQEKTLIPYSAYTKKLFQGHN
jgi:hypothetical protein